VLRSRLQKLADALQADLSAQRSPHALVARPFVDSAPVLEAELASKSGIGWRGKHTLILQREAGSMFFLGELFVNIPLPPTPPAEAHCGTCTACITACPTQAIRAPYKLDARRCISYLTIEHDGPIPHEFRRAIGNRIYGCDDCQTACPWNKFASRSPLPDFDERKGLNAQSWIELLSWDEAEFLRKTEGSAIRRIGFGRWRRNVLIGAGNALAAANDPVLRAAIEALTCADKTVAEARNWALNACCA
jgi:epoxyqueuosine reductase